MHDHLIDFNKMAWEHPAPGIRQKVSVKDGRKVRLVEFADSFVETGWCTKGHIGYVLDGRIMIDFDGRQI